MDASVASALAAWRNRKRILGPDLGGPQIAAQPLPEDVSERGRPAVPWEERIWLKVEVSEDHWLWTGAVDNDGNPRLRTPEGVTSMAARLVWSQVNGGFPPIEDACGVRRCVRPAHKKVRN